MVSYSHIEERYCTQCKRNVGVEYTRMDDGEIVKRCLSRACGRQNEAEGCFFNTQHSPE